MEPPGRERHRRAARPGEKAGANGQRPYTYLQAVCNLRNLAILADGSVGVNYGGPAGLVTPKTGMSSSASGTP
jgi:hypothetical protein